MESLFAVWGKSAQPLDAGQVAAWQALVEEARQVGGVLSLDPGKAEHAKHLADRLGDDSQLARYFPRKADIFRATAQAYALNGGPIRRSLLQMTPEEAGVRTVHPYVGITQLEVHPSGEAIVATGLVSHPLLLQALELILEIVDADTGKVLGISAIPPQFSSHTQQVQVFAPIDKANPPRRVTAGFTSHYAVTGEPFGTPSFVAASLELNPLFQSVTPFAPLPKNPTATMTKITIDRNDSTADYIYMGITPTNELIVPFSGEALLNFGYQIGSPPVATASLVLTGVAGGQYVLNAAAVASGFGNSDGSMVSWSMGPDWQQIIKEAAATYNQYNITLNATLNVQITSTNPMGSGTTSLLISSDPNVAGGLKPLQIQWGCVAPGARVAMADGSYKAIETVVAGDAVIADRHRTVARVLTLMDGPQTEPMWRIEAGGFAVQVTHDHPFITPDGPLPARALRVGDRVATRQGFVALTRIEEQAYAGHVYNLKLVDAPAQGGTFVCEGFVLGDGDMQNALDSRPAPASVPDEWQFDALNAARLAQDLPLRAA